MLIRRWSPEQDDLPILSADDGAADWWGTPAQRSVGAGVPMQGLAAWWDDSSDIPLLSVDDEAWQVLRPGSVFSPFASAMMFVGGTLDDGGDLPVTGGSGFWVIQTRRRRG